MLEERDDKGQLIVSYIYGDDLISQKRGANVSYYHYDGIGSTRVLTDNGGNVTDTYVYDAFGSLLSKTGSTINDYLFTGEQIDPNVGFYYLRARYMDPLTGRFIATDPYGGNINDPVSLHKYIYVKNNPVMYLDPSGNMTLGELGTSMAMSATISMAFTEMKIFYNYIRYGLVVKATDMVSTTPYVSYEYETAIVIPYKTIVMPWYSTSLGVAWGTATRSIQKAIQGVLRDPVLGYEF